MTGEECEDDSALYEEARGLYDAAKAEFEALEAIVGVQLGRGYAARVRLRREFDSAREWERLTADYLAARDYLVRVTGAWADRLGGRLTAAEQLVQSGAHDRVAAARRRVDDFRRNRPGLA